MIDAVFHLLISVLAAGLLTLVTIPIVHRRAVRLTTRRIDAMAPHSLSEIQAQKDQTRAEFAMSMRQLELKLEALKNKSIEQLTEVARRDNLIVQLKNKICEQNASIVALEAQQKAIRDQLRISEEELAIKSSSLVQVHQDFAEEKRRRTGKSASSAVLDQNTRESLGSVAASLEHAARSWEKDRIETARLREAVEQMANEVARLTFRSESSKSLSPSIVSQLPNSEAADKQIHEH